MFQPLARHIHLSSSQLQAVMLQLQHLHQHRHKSQLIQLLLGFPTQASRGHCWCTRVRYLRVCSVRVLASPWLRVPTVVPSVVYHLAKGVMAL
jgi:hypothetical protein